MPKNQHNNMQQWKYIEKKIIMNKIHENDNKSPGNQRKMDIK